MNDMANYPAETVRPPDSPWGAVVIGLMVAIAGGLLLVAAPPGNAFRVVGIVLTGLGGVAVQFGVIAAGVEYGLRRVRGD